MKLKRKISLLAMSFALVAILNVSCIGSFKLTSNVYDWNNQIGDKWINEVVFLAINIVPVYSICLFVDAVVFNSVEFWSGSNPVSMKDGESETQMLTADNGDVYQITAKKNKFIAKQVEGANKGEKFELNYNPEEQAWYMESNGQTVKLADIDGDNVSFFGLDGEVASTYTLEEAGNMYGNMALN